MTNTSSGRSHTWRERLASRLFSDVIAARVQAAVKVVDDRWWREVLGSRGPQDRPWGELAQEDRDALEAWRTNPLARNIVRLTTAYVVGRGIRLTSTVPRIARWLERFWHHPQNRLPTRLATFSDELALTGELFLVLYTNPVDGMSYLRAKPASSIDRIETDPDDLEREVRYHEVVSGDPEGRWWEGQDAAPTQPMMLHYAVNRPVGAVRGESDLAPILPWLKRYARWLEDRVRLNRYRAAFLWDVTVQGTEADIRAAQARYRTPPEPGSVNVHGPTEVWEAKRPQIEADDAAPDGRALRMILSAGSGMPLHWMGEPEGSTRTTARESALPTFQHLAARQVQFVWVLKDIVRQAAARAAALGHLSLRGVPEDLGLREVVEDLTREDNLALAQAAREIAQALTLMADRGWADDAMARAWIAKFAGERVSET
jgi:hypothetical protein